MGQSIVYGVTATGIVKPLLLDSSGNPIVTVAGGNTLLGYKSVLHLLYDFTDLAARTNTIQYITVPSGELWFMETVFMQYTGTITSVHLQTGVWIDPNYYIAAESKPVTSGFGLTTTINVPMAVADVLMFAVLGATLHNTARFAVNGYVMAVP
jgi:hypothetical protein